MIQGRTCAHQLQLPYPHHHLSAVPPPPPPKKGFVCLPLPLLGARFYQRPPAHSCKKDRRSTIALDQSHRRSPNTIESLPSTQSCFCYRPFSWSSSSSSSTSSFRLHPLQEGRHHRHCSHCQPPTHPRYHPLHPVTNCRHTWALLKLKLKKWSQGRFHL